MRQAMLCLLLVAVFVTVAPAAAQQANPPGGSIGIGSTIRITNGTGDNIVVVPTIGGVPGTPIPLAPGGTTTFRVPNDPSLIGLTLTLSAFSLDSRAADTTTEGDESVFATYLIVEADGDTTTEVPVDP